MFSPERPVEEEELSIISDIAEMLSPNRRVVAALEVASLERLDQSTAPLPAYTPGVH